MSSVDWMSMMGGLSCDASTPGRDDKRQKHLRPCTVHADDTTFSQAIGVGMLDIVDVPPDLMHACECGRDSGEKSKYRPHVDLCNAGMEGAGRERVRETR